MLPPSGTITTDQIMNELGVPIQQRDWPSLWGLASGGSIPKNKAIAGGPFVLPNDWWGYTHVAPPTFRAWHFSNPGRNTAELACSNTTFTITWYTNYQVGSSPAMGSTLYSSSALTGTPVNGGNLWYNLQEAFVDEPTSYQIGLGGTLDNFSICTV